MESSTSTVSRRELLRGGGLALAGAGLAASAGVALADEAAAAAPEQAAAPARDYDVYETDVVIVGAGNAGSAAAWSVAREGKRFIIINKGPLAQGGGTGMNWAGFTNIDEINPDTPLDELMLAWINKPMGAYLVNPELYAKAFDLYREGARDYDRRVRAVDAINNGLYIPTRDEEGKLIPFGGNMAEKQLFRQEMDSVIAHGATTLDQTMVTDFIVQDGVCCGVVGLHLPTGRIRVVRAKSTIVATFGCTTCNGQMVGIRPVAAGSMDNTFDTDMAAYRHGLGIAETEYAQWDCVSVEPSTFFAYNVDAQKASALVDVNGDPVFPPEDTNVNDRNYFSQRIGEVVVKEGRGDEKGRLFVDVNHEGFYGAGQVPYLHELFGYEVVDGKAPVDLEMYERGGAPIVDENIMTGIKGLFWTRGAGTYGENGGSCLYQNHIFGNYAGYKASEMADSMDAAPEFDWALVDAEAARLNAFRTNAAGDGIRPWEIRSKIADAFFAAQGTWRTEEKLNASLAELERIEAEDMPRQVVLDTHDAWNREWKEAIENENMLASALMGVRATLMREESRGGYVRESFPEQDDANWACLIVCRDEDGQMVLEKQPVPGRA